MSSNPQDIASAHALILAAGVGRRLGEAVPESQRRPKSLLEFGGSSLLARHVAILHAAGIASVTVVTGFGAGHVEAELARLDGGDTVEIIFNPDFREGSVVSLWAARGVLRGGTPVVLMDADVLYDIRLVARLMGSSHRECLLLDRGIEPGDEPVKLCVAGGRIVDFHKRPSAAHDWHGESVGFFRFSAATAAELAELAQDYVSSGRRAMEYEEPIRDMIMRSARLEHEAERFGFEDITGLPWREIDFPEDVAHARALLPDLVA